MSAAQHRAYKSSQPEKPILQRLEPARPSRILDFLSKGSRSSAAGRITSTVAVKKMQLDNVAAIRNQRTRVRQIIICGRHRIPRREISPVFGYVKALSKFAGSPRLRRNQRKAIRRSIVVRIDWGGLDCSWFCCRWRWTRISYLGLGRE